MLLLVINNTLIINYKSKYIHAMKWKSYIYIDITVGIKALDRNVH